MSSASTFPSTFVMSGVAPRLDELALLSLEGESMSLLEDCARGVKSGSVVNPEGLSVAGVVIFADVAGDRADILEV